MSWIWQGRQLTKAVKDKTVTFTYDSEGIRTSKTVGSTTTKYLLNGTQILAQTTNGKTLCFFYDQQGNRVAMADSSNHIYYYLYNLQGDVIALADSVTGKLVATYTYDAWGKCTVTNATGFTIGTENPFRYRGYYYDSETGRFINADAFASTDVSGVLSTNMFAYCENNPVTRFDPYGVLFWDVLDCFMAAISWTEFFDAPTIRTFCWAILDTVSLLPVVPSVSYIRRGVNVVTDTLNTTKRIDDFAHAAEYGIDTYRNLVKAKRGTGLEAHHIIEKRFAGVLDVNKNEMLSIALTKEEHQVFTNKWKEAIPYLKDYSSVTRSQLWEAAKSVYRDYPELRAIAKRTIYPKGVR